MTARRPYCAQTAARGRMIILLLSASASLLAPRYSSATDWDWEKALRDKQYAKVGEYRSGVDPSSNRPYTVVTTGPYDELHNGRAGKVGPDDFLAVVGYFVDHYGLESTITHATQEAKALYKADRDAGRITGTDGGLYQLVIVEHNNGDAAVNPVNAVVIPAAAGGNFTDALDAFINHPDDRFEPGLGQARDDRVQSVIGVFLTGDPANPLQTTYPNLGMEYDNELFKLEQSKIDDECTIAGQNAELARQKEDAAKAAADEAAAKAAQAQDDKKAQAAAAKAADDAKKAEQDREAAEREEKAAKEEQQRRDAEADRFAELRDKQQRTEEEQKELEKDIDEGVHRASVVLCAVDNDKCPPSKIVGRYASVMPKFANNLTKSSNTENERFWQIGRAAVDGGQGGNLMIPKYGAIVSVPSQFDFKADDLGNLIGRIKGP